MTHTPDHRTVPLSDMQLKQLMTDLNPSRIASRKQGGSTLSYLEAWDVKATLVRIFGFGGFSAEAEDCEILNIENNVPKTKGYGKDKVELPIEFDPDGRIKFGTANFRVTARVKVRLTIHQLGAVYTEWAASSQTGPDLGEVSDFAIKTAESDALKRAAIYLGTQFGLSLYNDGATQEVIRAIMAPGQEWSRGARITPQQQAPARRPADASGSVQHLRPEGVTDAEHAKNLANINASLSAQTSRSREERAAQYSHRGGDDVPAALDPSYDNGDREEAMAAGDGQH